MRVKLYFLSVLYDKYNYGWLPNTGRGPSSGIMHVWVLHSASADKFVLFSEKKFIKVIKVQVIYD